MLSGSRRTFSEARSSSYQAFFFPMHSYGINKNLALAFYTCIWKCGDTNVTELINTYRLSITHLLHVATRSTFGQTAWMHGAHKLPALLRQAKPVKSACSVWLHDFSDPITHSFHYLRASIFNWVLKNTLSTSLCWFHFCCNKWYLFSFRNSTNNALSC